MSDVDVFIGSTAKLSCMADECGAQVGVVEETVIDFKLGVATAVGRETNVGFLLADGGLHGEVEASEGYRFIGSLA